MVEERTELLDLLREAHERMQEEQRQWEEQRRQEQERLRQEHRVRFRQALASRIGHDMVEALGLSFVHLNESYEWTSSTVGVVHVNGRDVRVTSRNGHQSWGVWIPGMMLDGVPYSTDIILHEGNPDPLLDAIYRWATEAVPDPNAASSDD